MRHLIHEINLKFKAANATTTSSMPTFAKASVKLLKTANNHPQVTETQNKQDLVKKWRAEEVKNWFNENKFHEKIFREMDPCDGDLLYQMHVLQIEAPEFFYQSITKDKSVDLKSALIFSKKLKELFNT